MSPHHSAYQQEYLQRCQAEVCAFSKRGGQAFKAGRFDESVRMYSLASDLLSKVAQEDAKGRLSWELQLARVLFRRASARLQCPPAAACNTSSLRDAVADLDASLALQPSQPRAYLQKGVALLQLEEHSAASEALIAGLQSDSTMRPHFDQVSTQTRATCCCKTAVLFRESLTRYVYLMCCHARCNRLWQVSELVGISMRQEHESWLVPTLLLTGKSVKSTLAILSKCNLLLGSRQSAAKGTRSFCDDGWTAGQTLYIATDAAAAVIPGIA
eukprot:17427-Heterococcus_DN1.PRE.2